ncbi:hypothetical protein BH10BAC2_BH10BAC2_08570 [soil metagenome]
MGESILTTANHDAGSIEVKNAAVVEYWAKNFGITQTTLRRAVINAGPAVKNVKSWLVKNGFIH